MTTEKESDYWFVLRTKQYKEVLTYNELRRQMVETFLPLARLRSSVYGRPAIVHTPLFPCYVFARFGSDSLFRVKNTRGVREIVSTGGEPTAVPEIIMDDLVSRCINGVAELPPKRFHSNERVLVKSGVFRGWDAIFQRHLSDSDRVAILLGNLESSGVRVVLPTSFIARA